MKVFAWKIGRSDISIGTRLLSNLEEIIMSPSIDRYVTYAFPTNAIQRRARNFQVGVFGFPTYCAHVKGYKKRDASMSALIFSLH